MGEGTPYRIEWKGRVSEQVLAVYGADFAFSREISTTTMSGIVRDPAQLHGIVIHLTALGLELLSIQSLSETAVGGRAPGPNTEPSLDLWPPPQRDRPERGRDER